MSLKAYLQNICLIIGLLLTLPLAAQPGMTPKSVASPQDENFMYLISMQVTDLKQVPLCYSAQSDLTRVKIPFTIEDTINRLEDFALTEDELNSPDCFVPEMKMIFKNYTYVISMYCTTVKMFKNSAPYTPSATQLKTDFTFTESVYMYLNKLKKKHFKDLKIHPDVMSKIKLEKAVVIEIDNDTKELEEQLKKEEEEVDDKDDDIEDKGEFDKIEIEEKDPDGDDKN